ncbi:hypothetical protein TRIUR3_05366 [Triticum urartu]|uniref:Uncharacterized protein n=1 Tax=Triticum urartu TaxID=4572 RepID=M7ZY75_TRIUA|nr:hypothetical protein TRIUR3_05366 [Triticum urartu]
MRHQNGNAYRYSCYVVILFCTTRFMRGISKFYNGKSRSFTFLKEAIGPSGSAKVIAKADNAYSRKRKNLLAYSIMYDQSQITVPETYKNGITKRLAGLSRLRPSDGMSSNSSSSSSLSSDENEPPQQFIFVQSPDNTAQFASPTIPAPRLGSCASKIFAHANEVVFDGESATFAQPLLICLPGKTTGG